MNKFMTDIGFYNLIDSFFLYDAVNDDLLLATSGSYDVKMSLVRESMPAQMTQLNDETQRPEWSIVHGGGWNALVKTVRINQQFYAGALVDMNALNHPEQFTESGERGVPLSWMTMGERCPVRPSARRRSSWLQHISPAWRIPTRSYRRLHPRGMNSST